MTAVRTLCFAVVCCLALAACDREPTFDASSLPAYQKSLTAINARLSVQDRQKLQLALLTLAAGGGADYTAFALANPSSIANMEALDGIANPLIFLDRSRVFLAAKHQLLFPLAFCLHLVGRNGCSGDNGSSGSKKDQSGKREPCVLSMFSHSYFANGRVCRRLLCASSTSTELVEICVIR